MSEFDADVAIPYSASGPYRDHHTFHSSRVANWYSEFDAMKKHKEKDETSLMKFTQCQRGSRGILGDRSIDPAL